MEPFPSRTESQFVIARQLTIGWHWPHNTHLRWLHLHKPDVRVSMKVKMNFILLLLYYTESYAIRGRPRWSFIVWCILALLNWTQVNAIELWPYVLLPPFNRLLITREIALAAKQTQTDKNCDTVESWIDSKSVCCKQMGHQNRYLSYTTAKHA